MTGLSPVEQITVTDVSMDLVLTCAVNTWSRSHLCLDKYS